MGGLGEAQKASQFPSLYEVEMFSPGFCELPGPGHDCTQRVQTWTPKLKRIYLWIP